MKRPKNLFYKFQQFLILLIHLVLLYWMWFTLANAGIMRMKEIMIHFVGMSIYGAFLIRGTAYWAKHHHLKTLKDKHDRKHHEK